MAAKLISSSIGKKVGMALTGLMIYGFLVGHLAGNMLLLKGDGGEDFNAYSDFLTHHPFLIPVELVLLAAFALHIYLGISISRENRQARPQSYKKTCSLGRRSWASRTMVYSGIIILIFVVLHLKTFKYGNRGSGTLYDLVIDTFAQPFYAAWYLFAMVVLGFHLWHAFQSAFQTLGFRTHKKFWSLSILLSLILAVGFGFFPFWVFFLT